MNVEYSITIIEGPTPGFAVVQRSHRDAGIIFSAVSDHAHQIYEPRISEDGKVDVTNIPEDGRILVSTALQSFNVPALVERCHRAWSHHETIYLRYRDPHSMELAVPIQYARNIKTDGGDVLVLGVFVPPSVFEDEYPPLEGSI